MGTKKTSHPFATLRSDEKRSVQKRKGNEGEVRSRQCYAAAIVFFTIKITAKIEEKKINPSLSLATFQVMHRHSWLPCWIFRTTA